MNVLIQRTRERTCLLPLPSTLQLTLFLCSHPDQPHLPELSSSTPREAFVVLGAGRWLDKWSEASIPVAPMMFLHSSYVCLWIGRGRVMELCVPTTTHSPFTLQVRANFFPTSQTTVSCGYSKGGKGKKTTA